jgi:hypothetical protein
MVLTGSCHCRNIGFTLDWRSGPATIPARACGCSFCDKHGGVWTAHPAAHLRIEVLHPGRVNRYEFGTRTAQFHVCTACGVVPLVTSVIDSRSYAVVSVNALDDVTPGLLDRKPVSFDGESEVDRLARRRLHWIGNVEFA